MVKITIVLFISFYSAFGFSSVTAYFNHDEKYSYVDPYRGISREGSNLEQVLLENIKKAKSSIFIAVQELRLPLIAKALVTKMNEGVDVRVVIEHDYNFTILSPKEIPEENEYESSRLEEFSAFVDMNSNGQFERTELENRDAIYILREAGVPMIDDTSDSSKGSALMHHKFMVVDGKVSIVSTANFTMSCIHGDYLREDSRGNANSMVVIESESVAEVFEEEFSELWGNGDRGRFGLNKSYRGPRSYYVGGSKVTIQFSPTSKKMRWDDSVNGLIGEVLGNANESVKAALFVFSDQKLSNILEEIHDQGASVNFLIEPKFAFRYYSELLDLFGIQMRNPRCNFESGNNPWKNPVKYSGVPNLKDGDILHHKFAVVDNSLVIMGSQNWSDSANHLNDETLIVIEDNAIAQDYDQEFDRIWSGSSIGVPRWVTSEIESLERECL